MDKGSMELGVQLSDTGVTYYVQNPAWPRSLEGHGRRERERDGERENIPRSSAPCRWLQGQSPRDPAGQQQGSPEPGLRKYGCSLPAE